VHSHKPFQPWTLDFVEKKKDIIVQMQLPSNYPSERKMIDRIGILIMTCMRKVNIKLIPKQLGLKKLVLLL
jgi:hypothetical protein